MTVDSKPFTAREEISFESIPDGTRVRYVASFDFVAPLACLAKTFPGVMDRVGKSAMAGMKRALEDRFDPPRADWGTKLADRLVLPGMLGFTRFGYRSARGHWNPVSAYLRGRHIVITGATFGLGLATAQALAARGAELTLVARDASKAKRVAQGPASRVLPASAAGRSRRTAGSVRSGARGRAALRRRDAARESLPAGSRPAYGAPV